MAAYEDLRRRHQADAAALMPEMLERIEWPAERLAAHRQEKLRQLLRTARELSPWHGKRLREVNPDEVDEALLAQLPVMAKCDLMEHFSEIVTDERLRLDVVEGHVERLRDDAYLFDRFHACASGGSSGHRGVFVYDWEPWAMCYVGLARWMVRAGRRDPGLAAAPPVYAMVAASNATHMTGSLPRLFSTPDATWHNFPVSLPMDEIVAGLNAVQPTILAGYASALCPLANEAREGRLKIAPRRVMPNSEPLLPEIRAALEETWGVPVGNLWGTSESCIVGAPCFESRWLHLSDDTVIIEAVDRQGRPVPPGVRSDKIYLTNLFNPTLPLIRYEITDEVTFVEDACPCGSGFRCLEDLHGRLDDSFDYDGVLVHPHVFRSPLSRRRQVIEYQVRQTRRGATVAVRCTAPLEAPPLEAEIGSELTRLGLAAPEVTVTPVERLERQVTGKLKRFIPLG